MVDASPATKERHATTRSKLPLMPERRTYTLALGQHSAPLRVAIRNVILEYMPDGTLFPTAVLSLRHVLLLDRVQKRRALSAGEINELRRLKLVEGRAPNLFVSAKVAEWTEQRASYIRNRGFDDAYYRTLVTDFLKRYGKANRRELDDLLLPKLPDVLDAEQKAHKVRNLLQAMRRRGEILREGPKAAAIWKLR